MKKLVMKMIKVTREEARKVTQQKMPARVTGDRKMEKRKGRTLCLKGRS